MELPAMSGSRRSIAWNLACAVVVLLMAAPHAASAQDQAPAGDANELSRQATDPTASLMAFNLINDFRTSFTGFDDTGFEFRFQPVVPFRAFKASILLRLAVPYLGVAPDRISAGDCTGARRAAVPHVGEPAVGPRGH
jgi:hypothetical protein